MKEQTLTLLLDNIVREVLNHGPRLEPAPSVAPAPGSSVASASSVAPGAGEGSGARDIPVELSGRHVHLSEKDALALFGAPLTPLRELSQPGEFLCKERVRLIGPRGVLDNVAVLGPARSRSQAEISKTDARYLGLEVPVRASGDLAGSPGIILASHTGLVGLEQGLIVAMRHIHMTPEDARRFGLADGDLVSVRLTGERPVILEDVLVRVRPDFRLAMHIDADEGNSAGCGKDAVGRILPLGRVSEQEARNGGGR